MPKKKPTGQRIDAARQKAGLSVSALAREVDVSQPYLARVISGERLPVENARDQMARVDAFLAAIAEATGVDVETLA